ncbi:hypothetical protein O988_04650 [Pseudogymnoascus sp. VKM F-3808]|nr:hypothetical protein O988_04650 [Pseudogymnoascus sp. VKM F-3808]
MDHHGATKYGNTYTTPGHSAFRVHTSNFFFVLCARLQFVHNRRRAVLARAALGTIVMHHTTMRYKTTNGNRTRTVVRAAACTGDGGKRETAPSVN